MLLDIKSKDRFDTNNIEFQFTCLKIRDFKKRKREMQQTICDEYGVDKPLAK